MNTTKSFLRESIVVFLAGALLSAALDVILGNVAQRYVGILIALVSLLTLAAIATLSSTHGRINSQLDSLGTTSVWVHEPKEVYRRATEIIRGAQRRVLVISAYIPPKPAAKMPSDRPGYLEAIEHVIRRQIDTPKGPSFTYQRILQSSRADEVDHILRDDLLGEEPEQTFEHCRRVFEMTKEEKCDRIDIRLFIGEPVPSLPSLLVVDDRYVLVAFISPYHRFGEREQSVEMIGAIFVEDRTGQVVAESERIFNRFAHASKRVFAIGNSEGAPF